MAGYRIGQTVRGYKVADIVTEGNYAASYKTQKGEKGFFLKEYIDPTDTSPDFKAFVAQQDLIYGRLRKTKLKCVEDMIESFIHEFRYHQVKPFYKSDDLRRYLANNADLDDRLFLCRNWLGVMRELRNNGVVHQDLKPEQILMVEDRRAKRLGRLMVFADFDWAIVDGKGMKPVMTPGYATPEHLIGAMPDYSSDLFQTGIVLYEILTTTLPFGKPDHNNPADLKAYSDRIRKSEFKPVRTIQPIVPGWCGEVVGRMLAWNKAERPSIDEVIAAWDAKSAHSPVDVAGAATLPTPAPKSVPKWVRLRHIDSDMAMTVSDSPTPVARPNFYGAFRGVLSPSGQQLAAYFPSDNSPLFVVTRADSAWCISAPIATKNYVMTNGTRLGSSAMDLQHGDRVEIYSAKESKIIGSFNVEMG